MSVTIIPKINSFRIDAKNLVPSKYCSYQARSNLSMDIYKDTSNVFPKLPTVDQRLPPKYKILDNSSEVFADKFSSILQDMVAANEISYSLKKTFNEKRRQQDNANEAIPLKRNRKGHSVMLDKNQTLDLIKNDSIDIDKTSDIIPSRKSSYFKEFKEKTSRILLNLKSPTEIFDQIYEKQQLASENINNLKNLKNVRSEFKKVLKKLDLDKSLIVKGIKFPISDSKIFIRSRTSKNESNCD